jgi:hypothetical protein
MYNKENLSISSNEKLVFIIQRLVVKYNSQQKTIDDLKRRLEEYTKINQQQMKLVYKDTSELLKVELKIQQQSFDEQLKNYRRLDNYSSSEDALSEIDEDEENMIIETENSTINVEKIVSHKINSDGSRSFIVQWENKKHSIHAESECIDPGLQVLIKQYLESIGAELYTNIIHEVYNLEEYISWRDLRVIHNGKNKLLHGIIKKIMNEQFLTSENHLVLQTGTHIKYDYIQSFKLFVIKHFPIASFGPAQYNGTVNCI